MITFIKLVTGEEIIGEVVDIVEGDDKMLLLKNPLKVIYQQTPRGVPNTVVARFMVFGESENIVFNTDLIVAVSQPRKSFINYYLSALEHYKELDEELDDQLEYASETNSSMLDKKEKIVQDIFANILHNMPKTKPN